jgi:hypothetical protein
VQCIAALHCTAIRRFGSQSNGSPWPGEVTSWVCATIPMGGTVTFDCIPEVGPAAGWLHPLRVVPHQSLQLRGRR